MAKYRVHYETYVDVLAPNEDWAKDEAAEPDYEDKILTNISVVKVEKVGD